MRSYLSVYWMMYTMLLTSLTIQHTVYILSLPTFTCPRTIRRYVAKSQGRRRHVGWHRSGRKRRFHSSSVHNGRDFRHGSLEAFLGERGNFLLNNFHKKKQKNFRNFECFQFRYFGTLVPGVLKGFKVLLVVGKFFLLICR